MHNKDRTADCQEQQACEANKDYSSAIPLKSDGHTHMNHTYTNNEQSKNTHNGTHMSDTQ